VTSLPLRLLSCCLLHLFSVASSPITWRLRRTVARERRRARRGQTRGACHGETSRERCSAASVCALALCRRACWAWRLYARCALRRMSRCLRYGREAGGRVLCLRCGGRTTVFAPLPAASFAETPLPRAFFAGACRCLPHNACLPASVSLHAHPTAFVCVWRLSLFAMRCCASYAAHLFRCRARRGAFFPPAACLIWRKLRAQRAGREGAIHRHSISSRPFVIFGAIAALPPCAPSGHACLAATGGGRSAATAAMLPNTTLCYKLRAAQLTSSISGMACAARMNFFGVCAQENGRGAVLP